MKLIKQSKLVFYAGATEKFFEIDLCEVAAGKYVVNFRYGRRGGESKDGSRTAVPVDLKRAEDLFKAEEETQKKKGYVPEGSPRPAPAAPPPAPAASTPVTATAPPSGGWGAPGSGGSAPGGGGPVGAGWAGGGGFAGPTGGRARRGRALDPRARAAAVVSRLRRGELGGSAPTFISGRGAASGRGGRGAGRRRGGNPWTLNRAIWRAGELGLKEAEGDLLALLGRGGALRDYCVAWALARCGSERSLGPLNAVFMDGSRPAHVRWIAANALWMLYGEAGKAEFARGLLPRLPERLREAVLKGEARQVSDALAEQLVGTDPRRWEVLEVLYLVHNEAARGALLEELRRAPMRPPWFQRLRRIFKAAELRRDGEVFGVLAYRFEKEKAMFRAGRWGATVEGRWVGREELKRNLASAGASVAYGEGTRRKLQARAWTTLRRLGELEDPDFIKMAVGVLLPFVDADGGEERTRTFYAWRGSRSVTWPKFAGYAAFGRLLYAQSPRFDAPKRSRALRYKAGWRIGGAVTVREEPFQGLWDRHPQGLLHLLDESRCEAVHQFAARALRANVAALSSLDEDTALMLLGAPYAVTAQLGGEVGERLFTPHRPQARLLLAAAGCADESARRRAHRWMELARAELLKDGATLAELLVSDWADTRAAARRLVSAATLGPEVARALAQRLFGIVLNLGAGDEAKAQDLASTLLYGFSAQALEATEATLSALLAHPLEGAQGLGAQVLLAKGAAPSQALLLGLLRSPFGTVRAVAPALVARQPDSALLAHPEWLLALLGHPQEDMRAAALPLLRRVASDAGIQALVIGELVEVLLDEAAPKEVQSFAGKTLHEVLGAALAALSEDMVWRLIRAKGQAAQELGGRLLARLDGASMSAEQLVALAGHEILALREAAWALIERHPHALRADIFTAARLLEVRWDDTRRFAMRFFQERVQPEDLSVAALIAMCDSVRPEVQRFGQDMVQRHFQPEAGEELLLKLSEHPSSGVQLFVTNWLHTYASGHPARLEALEPYFLRALTRVNRGGLTKQRIAQFLLAEAEKGAEQAAVVGRVMARVSGTMAVQTKAAALEGMVKALAQGGSLALPIKPVGVR